YRDQRALPPDCRGRVTFRRDMALGNGRRLRLPMAGVSWTYPQATARAHVDGIAGCTLLSVRAARPVKEFWLSSDAVAFVRAGGCRRICRTLAGEQTAI